MAVVRYWNFSGALNTVLANKDALTMVSPWMYGVSGSGAVSPLAEGSAARAGAALARLRPSGLKLVPRVGAFVIAHDLPITPAGRPGRTSTDAEAVAFSREPGLVATPSFVADRASAAVLQGLASRPGLEPSSRAGGRMRRRPSRDLPRRVFCVFGVVLRKRTDVDGC